MINSPAVELLNRHLKKKKKEFAGFSLRWMAGKLSVSPAYLSQIFSGQRKIPAQLVDPLCQILDVDIEKRNAICRHLLKERGWNPFVSPVASRKLNSTLEDKWESVPTKDFDLLSDWHIIAIMEVTLLKDYDGSTEFIAKRLGLEEYLVRAAIHKLEEAGYMKVIDGKLKKAKGLFEFHSKNSKQKIRQYHKSVMRKAQHVLDTKTSESDLEKRLITSATVTCSMEAIPQLKEKVAAFLKDLTSEASQGDANEVYQIGIQFFPISENKK